MLRECNRTITVYRLTRTQFGRLPVHLCYNTGVTQDFSSSPLSLVGSALHGLLASAPGLWLCGDLPTPVSAQNLLLKLWCCRW